MGNESSRASILMSFIIRTVQALDALKVARRVLVGKEIDEKKEKEIDEAKVQLEQKDQQH